MHRLASLTCALALIPSVAHATDPDEPAVAATSGPSAAAVFDAAVDAHYTKMLDDAVCAHGCAQTVVAKKAIGDAGVLQVRKATREYGDVYAVVFGAGGAWFAADPLDDIEPGVCGMGKCVTDTISSVSIMRRGDVAWVTLRIASEVSFEESGASPGRRQIVIGCKLGPAPRCLRVLAGSHWDDGRATIGPRAIHVVDGDGARDVPIAF